MDKFEQIKEKIKRVLVDEFGALLDEADSTFIYECEDVQIRLSLIRHDPSNEEGRVFVEFCALVTTLSEVSNNLKSWIAYRGSDYLIGSFVLQPEDGETSVLFRYRMLADDIDPSEIYVASYALAETVNISAPEFSDGSDWDGVSLPQAD